MRWKIVQLKIGYNDHQSEDNYHKLLPLAVFLCFLISNLCSPLQLLSENLYTVSNVFLEATCQNVKSKQMIVTGNEYSQI